MNVHFLLRAAERFSLNLAPEDLEVLAEDIRNKRLSQVRVRDIPMMENRSLWKAKVWDDERRSWRTAFIIWDDVDQAVVTVLNEAWWQRQCWKCKRKAKSKEP